MGHALRADRLLIRPASGRQAGTGFLARTNRSKDTDRVILSLSHKRRTPAQPDKHPRMGLQQSHSPLA